MKACPPEKADTFGGAAAFSLPGKEHCWCVSLTSLAPCPLHCDLPYASARCIAEKEYNNEMFSLEQKIWYFPNQKGESVTILGEQQI